MGLYTLREELDILKPDIAWFPTGPGYDLHLGVALCDVEFEKLEVSGAALIHSPDLKDILAPKGFALRTYHPQSGSFNLSRVVKQINDLKA